jgi:hypothetical protein
MTKCDEGMGFLVFMFCFVLLLAGFLLGTFAGSVYSINKVQRSAVSNGVGEYVVDKDGWVKFQWKVRKNDPARTTPDNTSDASKKES